MHAISTLFGLSCLGMSPDLKEDQELTDWCRKAGVEIISRLPHGVVPKPGVLGRKQ